MTQRVALLVVWLVSSLAAGAHAESVEEAGEEPLRVEWSFTAIGQYTDTESPDDDSDVGGFFDQYEFTPNKSSSFPLQFGIREGALDLYRGDNESLVFQARLWSPTANLGLSGSQVDDPFFNQRLVALTRLDGIEIDLSYRRMRTEQLRLFPNTAGAGLLFDDRTRADDRFYRDRTGFDVEGRVRPYEVFGQEEAAGSGLRPVLSLRGGYEARDGDRQLRTMISPSNSWLGLAQDQERSLGKVGAGVLVAPDGLFTLTLDFDYEQLRVDDPVLTEGDLGFASPQDSRTVGFTPETDRYTGSLRFNSSIGDRAVLEGGFLVSELEQVSEYTPDQRAVGLKGNSVRTYGANLAFDVALRDGLSLNGQFKYDRRENDIERDTSLFDDTTQVAPFVEDWERFAVASELELQYWAGSRAGLGLRFEDVSRELDYAPSGNLRILPSSSHIAGDSRIVTLYGRSSARPWRRLRVEAELGYRWAPDTGYAMELDDNLYGELKASYVFAFERPVLLSGYLRGSTGENDDVTMVSGQGPVPDGARLDRNYERSHFTTGVTASVSPIDRLSLTASVFYTRDDQDTTLDLSSLQRYFQDVAPIDFTRDGTTRFENEQTSVVLGLHSDFTEDTDGSLSYSFTRAEADYSGSDETAALDLVKDSHQIESETHVLDFELRHRPMPGLELLGGYRFQDHSDDSPVHDSVASVVRPRGRSTSQHTVTLGLSLTSAFFE